MLVVVFRARLRELDAEYAAAAARLRRIARERYGCLAFHAVTEGDEEVAVSHWPDEAAIAAWRADPEHRVAQRLGRERWYASWSVEVAEVLRTVSSDAREDRAPAGRSAVASRPAPPRVRAATEGDVPAMLAIYAPVVERTAISFELVPPSEEELAARFRAYSAGWAWLAAEREGVVVGYAYGCRHRARAAYDRSVETSVFVAEGARGRGVGTALYAALLPRLAARGYANAYAGITLPNPASVALHRSAGFVPIGTFPRIGHKLDAWHDVLWLHRALVDPA